MEAEEIDNIFLKNKVSKKESINHLIKCTDDLPKLSPYMEVIEKEALHIEKSHSAYDIKLELLSETLNTIHQKNIELEEKIERDSKLYESLKELIMVLTIENEHIDKLENGSFSDPETLGIMEQTIKLLMSINLEKYTIKAVTDKMEEIKNTIGRFLKRFLMYLKSIFKSTARNGELLVHKGVYSRMKQYKFIYELSKSHGSYYEALTNLYMIESRRMYEEEFSSNIEILNSLVDSSKKIDVSVEVLLKSYESLVGCEVRFLHYMGFLEDNSDEIDREIFEGVSNMIIDFIDSVYEKAPLPTLIAITSHVLNRDESSDVRFYKAFRKELERKYEVLEDLYLNRAKEKRADMERVYLLNYIQKRQAERLGSKFLEVLVGNLSSVSKETTVKDVIDRLQCLYAIEGDSPVKKRGISQVEKLLPRVIASFVFNGEDEVENAKRMIGMVDLKHPGADNVLMAIKPLIIENGRSDRQEMERVFSSNVV